MKKKQKISILVVGEAHSDPAVPDLLLDAMKKISGAGVGQVFCHEGCGDNVVQNHLQNLEKVVPVLRDFITNNLQSYFYKIDNLRRAFVHEAAKLIIDWLCI